MADHHMPILTREVQLIVSKLSPRQKGPSLRWAQKFVKRNNLSLKVPNMIHHGRSAIASEENFQQHFSVLQNILATAYFQPSNIINMN